MAHDEVCVLCATDIPGPLVLHYNDTSKEETAARIAAEICSSGTVKMSVEEVTSIINDAIIAYEAESSWRGNPYTPIPPLEDTTELGYEVEAVAVGYFADAYEYAPCTHHGRRLHPTVDDAEVRRVRHSNGSGMWNSVVEYENGRRVVRRLGSWCSAAGFSGTFNTWIHARCWAYLQDWLHCTLPPRVGRAGSPLSIERELYELVNSRGGVPRVPGHGHLPCIDYDSALAAYDGCDQYIDMLMECRRGSEHTAQAIREGLRGSHLLSAVFKDCQYYMFMHPDRWPKAVTPPSGDALDWADVSLVGSPNNQPQAPTSLLPTELLVEVLQHLDLPSLFALARSCKLLYRQVLDRTTLSHILRRWMACVDGPLQWIPPSPLLQEEWDRAHEAMTTWMPGNPVTGTCYPVTFAFEDYPEDGEPDDHDYTPDEDSVDESDSDSDDSCSIYSDEGLTERKAGRTIADVPVPRTETPVWDPSQQPLPFSDPAFPLLAFVRACHMSDHMKARRRRWRIIKQFQMLWYDYRRDGWERDDFVPPNTTWAVVDGRYRCQC